MTELVLEGVICQSCGEFIDGAVVGYPRDCDDCKGEVDA